jgi:DNA-binding response OmpR family regulator
MTVVQMDRNSERWQHALPAGAPVAILVLAGEELLDRAELEQLVEDVSRSLKAKGRPIHNPPQPAGVSSTVHLDHAARRLVLAGDEVPLTHLEFELLAYLVRNQARAVTRTELMERVWNYQVAAGDRTVVVHVRRLRRKLAGTLRLTTVRGYGYRFDGWRETVPTGGDTRLQAGC